MDTREHCDLCVVGAGTAGCGLEAATASMVPALVSGNTKIATLVIAEKATDLVLGRPALAQAAERHHF